MALLLTGQEPLATPEMLSDFPGAPFVSSRVQVAGEQIRREAGWHIAPVQEETVVVSGSGGRVLLLPTLRLVSVSAVRDVSRDEPQVLTGWRVGADAMLVRSSGWPAGDSNLEVDLVHGFDTCPPELLPVLVERVTGRRVMQESLGSRSVTYAPDAGDSVSFFRLPARP